MLFIAFDSQVSDINDPKNNLALDAISERLLTKARESDIYAHLEDMNCANLSIESNDQHAEILIGKLKNDLAEVLRLSDGAPIKLNTKIGLAHASLDGDNYQSLIDYAKQRLI